MVEHLINAENGYGADINAKDKYGMTSLHHCAIRGNHRVLQKLLRTPGIIKEPRDMQDSTPLHLACTYNQLAIAQILINEDANIRALDSDLRTPLHEACKYGNYENVRILLEHQADVNLMDNLGKTSLMIAVDKRYHDENLVRLLLKHNANCNLESHDGMRAVDYARQVDPKSKIIPLINTFLPDV